MCAMMQKLRIRRCSGITRAGTKPRPTKIWRQHAARAYNQLSKGGIGRIDRPTSRLALEMRAKSQPVVPKPRSPNPGGVCMLRFALAAVAACVLVLPTQAAALKIGEAAPAFSGLE